MDQKKAVFFDTNAINNSNWAEGPIFGSIGTLEEIAKQFSIKIPQAVMDELEKHAKKKFKTEIEKLSGTNLKTYFKNNNIELPDGVSCINIYNQRKAESTLEYEICPHAEPNDFFERYYELALNNKPPFDSSTDKGFMDACIASTIERYLEDNPSEESVYLVTHDQKMKEYFGGNNRVEVFSSIKEFRKNAETVQLKEVAHKQGAKADARTTQTRGTASREEIEGAIDDLCKSPNFSSTHNAIRNLQLLSDDLGEPDKKKILKAAATNDQITWILTDDDVKQFVTPLFLELRDRLPDTTYDVLVKELDVVESRLDEDGNPIFSPYEKKTINLFIDTLYSNISTVEPEAEPTSDVDTALKNARLLLSNASIDNNSLSWESVADTFLSGEYSVDTSEDTDCFPEELLNSFESLLSDYSQSKRLAVYNLMSSKLCDIKTAE